MTWRRRRRSNHPHLANLTNQGLASPQWEQPQHTTQSVTSPDKCTGKYSGIFPAGCRLPLSRQSKQLILLQHNMPHTLFHHVMNALVSIMLFWLPVVVFLFPLNRTNSYFCNTTYGHVRHAAQMVILRNELNRTQCFWLPAVFFRFPVNRTTSYFCNIRRRRRLNQGLATPKWEQPQHATQSVPSRDECTCKYSGILTARCRLPFSPSTEPTYASATNYAKQFAP